MSNLYVTGDLGRAAAVASLVAPAGIAVQLRAPSDAAVDALARTLRARTAEGGARLVLNRRVELARRIGADGVHVDVVDVARVRRGWSDGWISAPCHDDEDVRRAVDAGASAVLVSPIFPTPGEGKGPPRGLEAVRAAAAIAGPFRVEVLALGGISLENAPSCFAHGASGIAAIRLFEGAPDAAVVARALAKML